MSEDYSTEGDNVPNNLRQSINENDGGGKNNSMSDIAFGSPEEDPMNNPMAQSDRLLDKAVDELGESMAARENAFKSSVFAGEDGLTTFGGILAMISTCVGGGIVGQPYSMYHFGMPTALVMNAITMTITCYSAYMYLKTKDLIPDKPESLFEIGYMCMGRKSVFLIASI